VASTTAPTPQPALGYVQSFSSEDGSEPGYAVIEFGADGLLHTGLPGQDERTSKTYQWFDEDTIVTQGGATKLYTDLSVQGDLLVSTTQVPTGTSRMVYRRAK
jgi:hypothetical protein